MNNIIATFGTLIAVILGYMMGYMHGFTACLKRGVEELNHTLRTISRAAKKDEGE